MLHAQSRQTRHQTARDCGMASILEMAPRRHCRREMPNGFHVFSSALEEPAQGICHRFRQYRQLP